MSEIEVPPRGTRVEVLTRYSLEWMNQYRRPTVGIVAHSNPWDKPGTFRLIGVDNCLGESVINLENVEYLKVLGTSNEPNNPEAANIPDPKKAETFEIKGSKDNVYIVTLDGDKSSCTCPAGTHGRQCKHVKAAREMQAS
jgi:hypothetical protein